MAGGNAKMTTIQKLDTVTVQSVDGTDGKIVYVWLDRPEARNACSLELLEDLATAYNQLSRNFDVRVIVMAGKGKTFCAGADLKKPPSKGFNLQTHREARHASKCWDRVGAAVRGSDAITIARVHGHASGGGLGVAFINDLVVMEETTRVWLPEVELGTPMIGGLTPVLASIVGTKRAMQLILLGEDVKPAELSNMGLINFVCSGEAALDEKVGAVATRIANQPEVALHSVKMQFRAIYHKESLGNMTEWDADQALIPGMRARIRNEQGTSPLTASGNTPAAKL